MAMTWMEEMRDRASRILPTPFGEAVDEATSEVNIVPDWERFAQICEFANIKPDNVTDIVRAVRRRIDHKLSKVQYFTVLLVQTLIKSCGFPVHKELNDTKGLLRDLVTIAKKDCVGDGDREAKEAALKLILSMSFWFDRHPKASEVENLAQLANFARSNGVAFDGIDPEEFTVLMEVPTAPRPNRRVPHSRAQEAQQQRAAAAAAGTRSGLQPQQFRPDDRGSVQQRLRQRVTGEVRVVDAIPLEPPTDAQTQAYMDNCMLLAECINAAEQEGAPLSDNDFIMSVASQVRQEHASLSLIVSSGIELPNIEMLLSVSDSQLSVLDRIKAAAQQAHTAPTQRPSAPPQPQPPHQQYNLHSQATTSAQPQVVAPALQVAPQQHPAAVPPVTYAPPSIDDLFAQVATTTSAPAPTAAPPPPQHATRSAPADATTVEQPRPAPAQTTRPMAFPRPSQDVHPGGNTSEIAHTDGPAPPQPSAQGSINDDFDAFLDSRLSGGQ